MIESRQAAHPSIPAKPARRWRFAGGDCEFGPEPLLMGIVNVTPDSFSDGGQFRARDAAVAHGLELAAEGAAFLDIGGESTRPGADPVSLDEELARVVPVVRELARRASVPLSIDTTKAEVARQAMAAGAAIVNDISGLMFDPEMPAVCAAARAGVVCMHIQGTPRTMQQNPRYDDVVREVVEHLRGRLEELERLGIAREAVVLDPGIGFGKTAEHNLQLLSHIAELHSLSRPVLVGHSRKRFLQKLLGKPLDERSFGTVGVSLSLAAQGTEILRLHEIAPTRDCLRAWEAVESRRKDAHRHVTPSSESAL